MDGNVYLITQAYTTDSIGQKIPTEVNRSVLCHEGNVNRQEFDIAGRHGLSADLCLKTQAINYSGEMYVEYMGTRYKIYRTFRNNNSDEIELYCSRTAE